MAPFQFGETAALTGRTGEDDDHLPSPFEHPEGGFDARRGHIGRDVV